ncbi:putative F-box/LRR-repeat protein At5g41840 [Medicago truncatula]|uniref:putative F-box/LRR-repeat protein At5g41840 n=1 Tax=Medicago truncatula TaxID=3880 RepID=UPI001967F038|nr:putative F-box/LRR-repeat protein At5g41840 [Medicago truncatula]
MKKRRREREASTAKEERLFSSSVSSPSVQMWATAVLLMGCAHFGCFSASAVAAAARYYVGRTALYDHENNLMDRINNLPVELLCHILSFLPTKLVFTATAFSKKWTPLCYSLSALDFHDETFKDLKTFDGFCRFVDNFMFSPLSTNQPLKSFRLNCLSGRNDKRDCDIFNAWLEAAKQRHVEELHLNLYFQTLNPIIFISQTLVHLKLEFIQLAIDTSCVDLPSLKTLHLKSVHFTNRNDYINFLSACPILEDLHAKSIYIQNANIAQEEGFKSLTFPRLVRVNINSTGDPFYGIDNVDLLFTVSGSIAQDTIFKVIPLFPNLVHIELVFCRRSLHCWDGVLQLLRHCPKLQILSIGKV